MVKPPSRPEKIVHVLDGEDLHGSPYLSRSYGPLAQKLGRISAISSIVWVLTFHLSRSKSSRYLSRDIPAVRRLVRMWVTGTSRELVFITTGLFTPGVMPQEVV